MSKPITPQEVLNTVTLPDKVIDTINTVIEKEWVYGKNSMTITQDILVEAIRIAMDVTRDEAYKLGYLDFEKMYSDAGWGVEYHKPETFSNESFDTYFKFTMPSSIKI